MTRLPLLPLLFLLSPGFGKASAQETRPTNMVTVSEGEDALLKCDLSSGKNIDNFDWRNDNGEEEKKEVFMYNKGSYYGQGLKGQSEQFVGRVEFFKDELRSGNASIKIKNTRLEDNGTYTCFLMEPLDQTGLKEFSKIKLNVEGDLKIRLNISGAAPLPYTSQTPFENGRVSLECKAQGVPKPEVEWRDSSGEALTAENKHVLEYKDSSGRFHVEVQLNVTRSDSYTCVVTQRSIYHQISFTVKVLIQDSATGSVAVPVLGALLGLVVVVVITIEAKRYCPHQKKQSDQQTEPDSKHMNGASSDVFLNSHEPAP